MKTNPQRVEAMGNTLDLILTAEQTGGAFSVVDFRVAPGFVAPPVVHRNMREAWWGHVLEGELEVEIDGKTLSAPAGTVVHVPKGRPFRWRNAKNAPARWMLHYAPGGFEQYFVELAKAAVENPGVEMVKLVTPLWAKYGLEAVKS